MYSTRLYSYLPRPTRNYLNTVLLTQQIWRHHTAKSYSTAANNVSKLTRSYLYVPASSDRMLDKSIHCNADVILYDLEDSVAPSAKDKSAARTRLRKFLEEKQQHLKDLHVAVRVNDVTTPFFRDDIAQIVSLPSIRTLVLPKVHSRYDLDYVSDEVSVNRKSLTIPPLRMVPSIESARAIWNIGSIAGWKSSHGPVNGGTVSGLLFAAEDYCADTSIIRTPSRRELLYTRSQIVIAAKAFGLEAIDMVCVHFKDLEILEDECADGRQLGFTGKQAIHPSQVEVINSTYVPSRQEIVRAARILKALKNAHDSERGAVGLDGTMIDAPMIKQAQKIIDLAQLAGLPIDDT